MKTHFQIWISTIVCASVLFLQGCAGLSFKAAPIDFENPAEFLKIQDVDPTPEESQGVLLRLKVPDQKELLADETLKAYSQIRDGKGISLSLRGTTTLLLTAQEGKDSFIQRSVTQFEKDGGKITEASEISPRGDILRFIEGRHESQAGKFLVKDHVRSAMYPENPVKIGDTWHYTEKMDARLESMWVKEVNPTPYLLEATCELQGFAIVNGRRCAVIHCKAAQTKVEKIKVLFKTLTAEIHATIEETDYLDLTRGVLAGKISKTQSHSFFSEGQGEDEGLSQAIYRLRN